MATSNGRGGGRRVGRNQIAVLDLLPEESLWLHWDRGVPEAQAWLVGFRGAQRVRLRSAAGGGDPPPFARSRGRKPAGVPPWSEPESGRGAGRHGFAAGIRRRAPGDLASLRPPKAVADLLEDLEAGKGPKTASEVVYYLAHYLTDRVDTLISGIADQLDAVEELVEADERASPDQHQLRTLRRRSAGCGATSAPQRDIYSQLARYKLSWFVEDDADYWNELNNRLTRNLEELELIRERISVLQEAESRRITERMNRTMYLLGIITGFSCR